LLFQNEVFNTLFVWLAKERGRYFVYCFHCAQKESPTLTGFLCLEEFTKKSLMEDYNGFVLVRKTNSV
jgi:hypothetical protein